MPVNPRVMPFAKHFVELRKRFIIILIVFVILLCVFYMEFFYKLIMDVLLYQIRDYLPDGHLTVLGPFETLTFRFKMSFYASTVGASPVILYNIFAFFER
jgi:sec-independent protein translocase protein TatC